MIALYGFDEKSFKSIKWYVITAIIPLCTVITRCLMRMVTLFHPILMSNIARSLCNRPCRLSDNKMMTFLMLPTLTDSAYLDYVCQHMHRNFPHNVFYNRFVERQGSAAALSTGQCPRQVHRLPIIGSTPLEVYHIKWIHSHKTMRGWVANGKSTIGWFYGMKLHLVINDKAEII